MGVTGSGMVPHFPHCVNRNPHYPHVSFVGEGSVGGCSWPGITSWRLQVAVNPLTTPYVSFVAKGAMGGEEALLVLKKKL